MNIEFTPEEKQQILLELGYTLTEEKRIFDIKVYHDEVEEVVEKVLVVSKIGIEMNFNFHMITMSRYLNGESIKYQHINHVFEMELKKRIIKLFK